MILTQLNLMVATNVIMIVNKNVHIVIEEYV